MKDISADDISALIRTFDESEWKELALQIDDCRVFISRDPDSAGAPWQAPAQASAPHPAASSSGPVAPASPPAGATATQTPDSPPPSPVPDNCVVVEAPNLGIFYRAPKPGAPPYVELGAKVEPDTEICLIEVMKLFTPVQAGIKGTIRHICIEDGEMVEHGQSLFYIEPDA